MVGTEEIKELIRTLIKARKNIRIYPSNNPIYNKTVDDVHNRFSSIFDYTDSFTLKIRQYEITSGEEVVYYDKEKDENLAIFFFKDGIRELTFKKGIPREEVEEFLKLISLNYSEIPDDDIVTLMWEMGFQFIHYVVDNTILLEDETYEESAIQKVREVSAGDEEILKAYEEASGADKTAALNILPLTNDDINSIIREIESRNDNKIRLLVHILFEMLTIADGSGEYEEIAGFIKKSLEYAMSSADLETVIYTANKTMDTIENCALPESATQQLKGIEYFFNSNSFIKLFGSTLDTGVVFSEAQIDEFSTLLNRNSIPHLITILGELKNITSRRILIRILSELGRKDISLLAAGLSDKRWYVVRNIIYILRQIGNKVSARYLTGAVKHQDIRVKKEAIRALGEIGSPEVLDTLSGCLSDEDESVRITAVKAIGLIRSPVSRNLIIGKIRENNFRERSFTEKREVLETLTKWSDGEVIDTLIGILKKRSFFKRAKNDETRAAAAYSLGTTGSPEAVSLLEKLRNSKNKLLRDNVLTALKRIEDGKA